MPADVSRLRLPARPAVAPEVLRRVGEDYARFAESGLPRPLEDYLAERYKLDVSAEYAGMRLRNPWGKASGQLSMTARQVQEDVEAGLGFVVLKTVIAQDEQGGRSMQAWAIKEARMVAEPIVGRSGETGWTISWKGRGWWQSFDEYLQLVRDAREIARGAGALIVPSCKYHLPRPGEPEWKRSEYDYTTRRLLQAWGAGGEPDTAMPLEKDFSPTLAGSDLASVRKTVLEWLRAVPPLIREAAEGSPVRVGLKLFNALFDDAFQLEMLHAIHQPGPGRPDYFVYANRLFDPEREFDGHRGIAYGGPDLSDRNLRVMQCFLDERGSRRDAPLPWSATGNITTGKMAAEYALLGAASFQLHTFFQLPASEYAMKHGSKTEKALLELYFHPETGFVPWMLHLAGQLEPGHRSMENEVAFVDLVGTSH